ncbi:MAG: hypothetical protein ACPGSB_11740 [Opitutales bacterium]
MQNTEYRSNGLTPERWLLVLALVLLSGSQLCAFNQGSLFLYAIQEKKAERGTAGRIAVTRSFFTNALLTKDSQITETHPRSEFEAKITGLKTITTGLGKVSTTAAGTELQDKEAQEKKVESTFGEPEFGESGFGESQPTQGGFFFSY